MTESREHFRAPVFDQQFVLLIVGLERQTVQLVDQSSGGLSMFAERLPEFPCDSPAEVKYSDGFRISGRIKHIDRCDDGFRIGFQRSEMISRPPVDLRDSFQTSQDKSTSIVTVAAVLLVGLGLGWAYQSGGAMKLYDRAMSTIRSR